MFSLAKVVSLSLSPVDDTLISGSLDKSVNYSLHFWVGTKIFRETVKSTIYSKPPFRETQTLREFKNFSILNFHANFLMFSPRKLETLVSSCMCGFAFSIKHQLRNLFRCYCIFTINWYFKKQLWQDLKKDCKYYAFYLVVMETLSLSLTLLRPS
jgi:hypothetical protein